MNLKPGFSFVEKPGPPPHDWFCVRSEKIGRKCNNLVVFKKTVTSEKRREYRSQQPAPTSHSLQAKAAKEYRMVQGEPRQK